MSRSLPLAQAFGEKFGKAPVFAGAEAPTAWVNSTALATKLFGYPTVPVSRMIDWVADWIDRDMPEYNKPTGYEVRDGAF